MSREATWRNRVESFERKTDDARDAWVEVQNQWAFRYFNDMRIATEMIRKAYETRGKRK